MTGAGTPRRTDKPSRSDKRSGSQHRSPADNTAHGRGARQVELHNATRRLWEGGAATQHTCAPHRELAAECDDGNRRPERHPSTVTPKGKGSDASTERALHTQPGHHTTHPPLGTHPRDAHFTRTSNYTHAQTLTWTRAHTKPQKITEAMPR